MGYCDALLPENNEGDCLPCCGISKAGLCNKCNTAPRSPPRNGFQSKYCGFCGLGHCCRCDRELTDYAGISVNLDPDVDQSDAECPAGTGCSKISTEQWCSKGPVNCRRCKQKIPDKGRLEGSETCPSWTKCFQKTKRRLARSDSMRLLQKIRE